MSTATTSYETHRREIENQIAALQTALVALDARQQANPRNWGFSGTAAAISAALSDAQAVLGQPPLQA